MNCRRVEAWQPIGQPEQIGEVQLSDEPLIFAKGRHDLARMLGSEIPAETPCGR